MMLMQQEASEGRMRMRKLMGVMLAFWLAVVTSGMAAFTPPTPEQIAAAAADPGMTPALLKGAAPGEAAQVVIQIIQAVDSLDIPLDEKKARVEVIVTQLTKELGENAAAAMNVVAANVNPALLPAVGVVGAPVAPLALPIAQPLAPPIAPKYPGQ
jgi:hypothetical protein